VQCRERQGQPDGRHKGRDTALNLTIMSSTAPVFVYYNKVTYYPTRYPVNDYNTLGVRQSFLDAGDAHSSFNGSRESTRSAPTFPTATAIPMAELLPRGLRIPQGRRDHFCPPQPAGNPRCERPLSMVGDWAGLERGDAQESG